MNLKQRSIIVLAIQFVLVCSVYAKYRYEQATLPRVWVQARQYDPDLPMRGRYLALQFIVDGCSFGSVQPDGKFAFHKSPEVSFNQYGPVKLVLKDHKLIPVDVSSDESLRDVTELWFDEKEPCQKMRVSRTSEFFISEHATTPFPLKPGESLWVEVTVPPKGPPRPIQLAIEKNGTRTILQYR